MEKSGDELLRAFGALGNERTVEKGAVIYDQGERAEFFYYLKKGAVKVYISSENGSEKLLSTVKRGSVLGEAAFFDGQPRISSAKALSRCVLVPIDKAVFSQIIRRSPDAAMEIFRLQAQTIRMLSVQLDSMTFVGAKGRIAQFLLSASGGREARVSTTHEEIAGAICVSRVTVSKLMRQLVSEGLIKTGYRCIDITDSDGLKKKIKNALTFPLE